MHLILKTASHFHKYRNIIKYEIRFLQDVVPLKKMPADPFFSFYNCITYSLEQFHSPSVNSYHYSSE